jgi:NAD(P)-dependent dehydrogenase (short-subunit alcohol dehydrogenase family)
MVPEMTVTAETGMSLAGRVAVVVGGPTGVGHRVAARLREAGADVVIASTAGRGSARRMNAAAATMTVAVPDSADPRLMAGVAERVVGEYGRLDLWVHLARRARAGDLARPRGWDPSPASTAWGGYLGMRAVAIRMATGSGGVIVNVSLRPCGGGVDTTRLTARLDRSLGHLTAMLATELESFDVRVFGIQPMRAGDHVLVERGGYDLSGRMVGRLPFGAGQVPSLPDAVAFCASDLSVFMSGSTLLATT